MNTTTIILPVSRRQYLDRVFASLERLNCDREITRLLVHVDGDADLYLAARNLTEQSNFVERLCVQSELSGRQREASINARRRRIAAIHNNIGRLLKPCRYVFLVEDDGILPAHALSRLMMRHVANPHAGFIEGVELGRWGLAHVGAWRADDVYEPRRIESVFPRATEVLDMAQRLVGRVQDGVVEDIDAGGLYCCLARYELYAGHLFKPYVGDSFGPDVDWGLTLRQQGYRNYLDWSVQVEHLRQNGGSLHPRSTKPVQVIYQRVGTGTWHSEIVVDNGNNEDTYGGIATAR
jgi:hypothetical protein